MADPEGLKAGFSSIKTIRITNALTEHSNFMEDRIIDFSEPFQISP